MKKIYTLILSILVASAAIAQVPVPVEAQEGPIMLIGGVAHLGNGQVIQNSAIGFDNGKITQVADASGNVNTDGFEVIRIDGKHVYPGFILPNSQVGLNEVNAIRHMRDFAERGNFNPNIRSVISYNTDSEYIATFRFNGVLLAESTPTSGRISGSSSLMEMEGWNWEDAAHTVDLGMHINWPNRISQSFDFSTFTVKQEPNKNYDKQVTELDTYFKEAKAYGDGSGKVANLKLASMQRLFDGSQTLFIHTNEPTGIVESVLSAQANGVQKVVVVSSDAALMVAEFLKDNNIGVIIPPTHRMPQREDSDVYGPYKLPKQLFDAGLTVGIAHAGMMSQSRNLPFFAGTAASYGLDKEEALKMITSNTAKLLGVDDRVGTIEVGKDATLFVSQGDALDFRTNMLSHAFIGGKLITLNNKQEELFERYSRKYGHID